MVGRSPFLRQMVVPLAAVRRASVQQDKGWAHACATVGNSDAADVDPIHLDLLAHCRDRRKPLTSALNRSAASKLLKWPTPGITTSLDPGIRAWSSSPTVSGERTSLSP